MRHMPLQAYYALKGKQDRVGRLPGNRAERDEAQMLRYPDDAFWEHRCEETRQRVIRLAENRLGPAGLADLAARFAAIPDEWLEQQTWLALCVGWRRVERLLLAPGPCPSPEVLLAVYRHEPAAMPEEAAA